MILETNIKIEPIEQYVICRREPVWSDEKPGGGISQIIGYENYWFVSRDITTNSSSYFWSQKFPAFFEDFDDAEMTLNYLKRWHPDLVQDGDVVIRKIFKQTSVELEDK
jgi:hypothetical protein